MKYNRNYGCRITDNILINGLKAIVMENRYLRVTVLLDKGADIYELLYKPLDVDMMWRGPVELQNPSCFIPSTGNEAGTFIDRYEGGWQEILPSGGAACEFKGVRFGQHGEISNIPWKCQIIKDEEKEICIELSVRTYRTAFYLRKKLTLKIDDPTLYINEILVNEAEENMELMWGHHPAIGHPFLSEHCNIETSATKVITHPELMFDSQRLKPGTVNTWPRVPDRNNRVIDLSKVPSKNDKTADMLYLTDFEGEAWYRIHNQQMKLNFEMKWDKDIFKYLWMWQVCKGAYGYPWYGRTYCMALEPWSSYPTSGLYEAVNNRTAMNMAAAQTIETDLSVIIYEDQIN